MKAIIALLIATLSLTAHANTASKEVMERIATLSTISKEALTAKLIGTWQCTYHDNVISYDNTLIFHKDGTLISQKTSQTTDTPTRTATIHTTRDWAVRDDGGMWVLTEKVTDTTHFEVNDSLDEEFELRAYLDGKPISESVMSFEDKDGKQMMTRIDGTWGVLLGECTKR